MNDARVFPYLKERIDDFLYLPCPITKDGLTVLRFALDKSQEGNPNVSTLCINHRFLIHGLNLFPDDPENLKWRQFWKFVYQAKVRLMLGDKLYTKGQATSFITPYPSDGYSYYYKLMAFGNIAFELRLSYNPQLVHPSFALFHCVVTGCLERDA